MDLPELAKNPSESIEREVRNLISWLPDPYECPECKRLCRAERTYDYRTAAFNGGATPSWYCESCDSHYHRQEPWME